MQIPIKYKLYGNRLYVRFGIEDVWKDAEIVDSSVKVLTPITQPFGNDFIWTDKSNPLWVGKYFYRDILGIPGHNGIDFTAPSGTRLYAPHDGKITELMTSDGYGIRLQGKEYQSVFYHLKEFHCSLNQDVKAGDFIALCDNTGRYTTGSHLHWGVRPNNFTPNAYNGYMDFRGFIEDIDVLRLPYQDGQCLIRTQANGEFYVVENGDLVYYASDKQWDRHIPIIDFFLKQKDKGLPKGFIKPIKEEEFKLYNNLIR